VTAHAALLGRTLLYTAFTRARRLVVIVGQLKALAMARNVARQEGRRIARFTTAVFDLVPLGDDWDCGEAPKSDPRYYYRPFKTILVRTVQDGGESFYVQGDHRATVLRLHQHLRENGVDDLG